MREVKIQLKHAETFDTFVLDMDDLSRALDDALLKDLECPVCLEYMVPPIKLCKNGHNVCSRCREAVQCCPTCRAAFLETRNVVLENIIRRLTYPCANRQNGCSDLFSIEDIAEHHAGCVYRKIKCPFHINEKCSWKGFKNDFKEHAKAAHRANFHESSSFGSNSFMDKVMNIISYFGELFVQYKRIRDGRLYSAVQLIGTSSEASKYKCHFTLRAANSIEQISKTLFVTGYSEDFETIFNSGKCFCLDEAVVGHFLVKGNLDLTVTMSAVK
jgi:E3 ubiquitin-protein ligase SIAH1